MPMFHYEATNASGKTLVGSMNARDEGTVRARLAQNGLTPHLIEAAAPRKPPRAAQRAAAAAASPPPVAAAGQAGAGGGPTSGQWRGRTGHSEPNVGGADSGGARLNLLSGSLSFGAKSRRAPGVVVPPRALAQFYRQLAAMLKSGVPITQALPQLASGERNRILRAALKDMEANVAAGRPLSDAMARHPRAFSAGHVGLVRSGEAAGFLDRAMEELAVQVEANWGLQNQLNLSVLYGKLLLGPFFLGIVYIVVNAGSLANAGGDKVAAIIRLLGKGALVAVAAAFIINAAIPLLWRWVRGTSFGGLIDAMVARAPLIGATRRMNDRVRTLSSMGSSLTAGIPLFMAWTLAAEAAETAYTREHMGKVAHLLNQGQPLPDVMALTGLYDGNTMQMVRSGDLAGNLPEMLTQAAGYQREQVNYETKRNSTVFGFLFILGIILVVGGFIVMFWMNYWFGAKGLLGPNGAMGGAGFLGGL